MATAALLEERTLAPIPKLKPDGACIHIPASALTFAGFRAWATSDDLPENIGVTYVDKGIYLDMSKETEHNALAKTEISGVVWNVNHELELGNIFFNGVLVTNQIAQVSTNPDATLLTYAAMDKGRVRWVAGARPNVNVEIEGTPDWILEIVSDSSLFKDTQQLRAAYHRAGIREYWLVDVRRETIDFQILLWRKKGYVPAPVKDGWQKSRVFGRAFRLDRSQNRRGYWRYTLRVRPG